MFSRRRREAHLVLYSCITLAPHTCSYLPSPTKRKSVRGLGDVLPQTEEDYDSETTNQPMLLLRNRKLLRAYQPV
ncbi:unnamed protein product [Lasius platythorax]|uniref:Secreted protein n=1 Tax=Lasius platythorax TaxID=488582 RepID=A0AAV2NL01_9HYME